MLEVSDANVTWRIAPRRPAPSTQRLDARKVIFLGFKIHVSGFNGSRFFSVAVFLPLKRLNPERVTGLVENLSESLLSRKFGADTVSTLVREQSL